MTQRTTYLAIEVAPTGLCGCRALVDRGARPRVEQWLEERWDTAAPQQLAERGPALARFVATLAEGAEGRAVGACLLHPSWTRVRRMPIPPAGKRQLRQFLALQLTREPSLAADGAPVWDYAPLPAATGLPGEALVVVARASTLAPIQAAFAASGVPLVYAGTSSAALHRALRSRDAGATGDGIWLFAEDDGVHVLQSADGRLADCHWLPLPRRADGALNLPLLAGQLSQCLERSAPGALMLTGAGAARARVAAALPAEHAAQELPCDTLPMAVEVSPALAPTLVPARAAALSGLLVALSAPGGPELNLLAGQIAGADWRTRLLPLLAWRRTLPAAVALLFGLFLFGLASRTWEARMYSAAAAHAEALRSGSASLEANLAVLHKFERERVPLLGMMAELAKLLPDSVTLTQLTFERDGRVVLAGKTNDYASVEALAARLSQSASFRDARANRMGAQKGSDVNFTVECALVRRMGGAGR